MEIHISLQSALYSNFTRILKTKYALKVRTAYCCFNSEANMIKMNNDIQESCFIQTVKLCWKDIFFYFPFLTVNLLYTDGIGRMYNTNDTENNNYCRTY